ncbi:uncharacterized protein LOC144439143 [Glandiceps talaboti]
MPPIRRRINPYIKSGYHGNKAKQKQNPTGGHRLEAGRVVDPTGVHRLIAGRVVDPTGVHRVVAGRVVDPTGVHRLVADRLVDPTGVHRLEAGRVVYPTGVHRLEAGRVVYPTGVHRLVAGRVVDPTGVHRLIAGRVVDPTAVLLGGIIIMGIMTAIPITMIVMGALYMDDCPAEKYIPTYLIVGGVFQFVALILSMWSSQKKRSGNDDDDGSTGMLGKCVRVVSALIYLFNFAWFIAGNVWIYRTEPDYDDSTGGNYCDQTLYLFSFWLITTSYILIGLGGCIGIIVGCCICCSR